MYIFYGVPLFSLFVFLFLLTFIVEDKALKYLYAFLASVCGGISLFFILPVIAR